MIRHIGIFLLAATLTPVALSAQQPGQHPDSAMMMNHERMMQQVQSADARMDRLVSEMNRTTGQKKVESMAAVINELVAQRKQMRSHMMQMMQRMHSEHMMGGPRMVPPAPADSAHAGPP
ncbi:MAG TPA: hypothetical protein VJU17_12260 [Gemmatimonadales bacterium]|nr:hypothetical protein [Gemmatimonadales bacterium]